MVCGRKRPSDSVKSAQSWVAERTISSKCGLWHISVECSNCFQWATYYFYFFYRSQHIVSISLISRICTDLQSNSFCLDLGRFQNVSDMLFSHLVQSNINKQTFRHHSQLLILAPNFKFSKPLLKKPFTSPHTIHGEWMCGGFCYSFANVNFALWRQVFNISDLTLRDCVGSASNMCVFSVKQTSQNFAPAVYTPVFARMLHEISCSFPASFNAHT